MSAQENYFEQPPATHTRFWWPPVYIGEVGLSSAPVWTVDRKYYVDNNSDFVPKPEITTDEAMAVVTEVKAWRNVARQMANATRSDAIPMVPHELGRPQVLVHDTISFLSSHAHWSEDHELSPPATDDSIAMLAQAASETHAWKFGGFDSYEFSSLGVRLPDTPLMDAELGSQIAVIPVEAGYVADLGENRLPVRHQARYYLYKNEADVLSVRKTESCLPQRQSENDPLNLPAVEMQPTTAAEVIDLALLIQEQIMIEEQQYVLRASQEVYA